MQGFNMGRYRPPSTLDAALSSTSEPASKRTRLSTWSTPSAPTIRFEMPFAIWCSTCPSSSSSSLIGQGVRFNAFKAKVGNYYSSPVWQFRMKHTACGGWIEIRTDPAKSDFVVSEGARKRETGDDRDIAERVGGVLVGGTDEERDRERRRTDAFAALEGKKEEKERVAGEGKRIEELRSRTERDWRDVDAANRKLRNGFRVGRKAREKDKESVEVLKEKMGLGIDFVEENDDDKKRAGYVEFGQVGVGADAASKPLFSTKTAENPSRKAKGGGQLELLQMQLAGNSRAAMNPFALNGSDSKTSIIPGVKRKRAKPRGDTNEAASEPTDDIPGVRDGPSGIDASAQIDSGTGVLVDYDSD